MKSTRTELSRRDFLKTTAVAGAGLTLSFTIPGGGAREASAAAAFEPNAALTITPDGHLTATWDSNTAWGTVTVQNGRARFEMSPTVHEGTIRLYQRGSTRELVLEDELQSLNARVEPVR